MTTPEAYDPLTVDKYLALLTHMPQGFCIIEVLVEQTHQPTDYRFVEVNPAFQQQTGLQHVLGKRARELMPDIESYWVEAFGQIAQTGQPLQLRNYNQSTQRWYTVSASRVGPAGSPLIAVLFEDITERRALEQRQEFLLNLSDAIRPLADPVDVQRTAMEKVAEHFGVDSAVYHEFDADGDHVVLREGRTNARIAMPPLWRLRDFGQAFYEDLNAGRTIYYEDTETDPRLQPNLAAYRATGIRSGVGGALMKRGRLAAALGITHSEPRLWTESDLRLIEEVAERTWDAVERARAEEALRREDRRKDEFLAMLGHELRNPLASISNILLLLELTRGEDESLSYPKAVELMGQQAGHMSRMVDDLLDVGRIRYGLIQLQLERLDLRTLVSQTVEAAQPLYGEHQRQLSVALPTYPLLMMGDKTRLSQVLMNLLTNGVKYTQPGGQVRVSLELADNPMSPQQALLRVSDDGIGIAPDQRDAIFDIFVQGETTLDRPQGGLGLGLAVVKQLVVLHEGSIEVLSEGQGKGSEFLIRLPLTAEAAQRVSTAPLMASAVGNRGRVLVVEDNQTLADMTARLVGLLGYQAQVSYSGAEALLVAQQWQPEVILLDLGMPYMDGFAFTRQLRQQPFGEAVSIIALTGYGQESIQEQVAQAGFAAYLLKPLNLPRLRELLQRLVVGKQAES